MASSLRQLQRKRLAQPPSTGSFSVDFWFRQIADTFNKLPPMSVFSFTNPNSNLSAIPGTLGFNINSANTAKLWVKEVGSGNTGWSSLTSALEFYRSGYPTDASLTLTPRPLYEWSYLVQGNAPILKGPASLIISSGAATSQTGFATITWAEFTATELA